MSIPETDRQLLQQWIDQCPNYALDAPGLLPPNGDLLKAAERMSKMTVEAEPDPADVALYVHYLHVRMMYQVFGLPLQAGDQPFLARVIPGHVWGPEGAPTVQHGPRYSRVMILGKAPGRDEEQTGMNFTGPSGQLFRELLRENDLGVEAESWYITNLVKWPQPSFMSGTLPAKWVKSCMPILQQELRLVRPDLIICLGSEAGKALLGKNGAVGQMLGRVENYSFPVSRDQDDDQTQHTSKVIVITHPAAVLHNPEVEEDVRNGVMFIGQIIDGHTPATVETDIDHRMVNTEEELEQIVDWIMNDPDPASRVIAVDSEWHGTRPDSEGAFVRTIQFSHKAKFACCVILRHAGGEVAFRPKGWNLPESPGQAGVDAAVRLLKKLLEPSPGYVPRLGGHFFRADLPQLLSLGIDAVPGYTASTTFDKVRTEGGWETGLMAHAVKETGPFGLEYWFTRHTSAPRYDLPIMRYLEQRKASKLDGDEGWGYGYIPDEILYSYAAYDADVTRRLYDVFCQEGGLLDRDRYNLNSWKPYWRAHRASVVFLEMEQTGLLVDTQRQSELSDHFELGRNALLKNFQERINWPDRGKTSPGFNPRSSFHKRELLFGEQYTRKKGGGRVRPEGALTLGLTPVKSTGKRAKAWAQVIARGEQAVYTPATDGKETLKILASENPLCKQLNDITSLATMLSTVLRPAKHIAATPGTDEEDEDVYEKGFCSYIASDKRVHTHFRQTVETGRVASRDPNCQNMSNKDELYRAIFTNPDYADFLTGSMGTYPHSIRSMIVAPPGHVLMEADWTGAELCQLGWQSDDPALIEHVRRNSLDESDPAFRDMHSTMAVTAFQLNCAPTKKGLKSIGKSSVRTVAKTVIFGIMYGRAAKALVTACLAEGAIVTEQDCQRMIDLFAATYPVAWAYLASCRERVLKFGFITNFDGRHRRFAPTDDRAAQGDQERQAMNAPVQGGVADAMNAALWNLYSLRNCWQLKYRLALQIHDACMLQVPYNEIAIVRDVVFPKCMEELVPIVSTDLDGQRIPGRPIYHLKCHIDMYLRWGEPLSKEEIASLCSQA